MKRATVKRVAKASRAKLAKTVTAKAVHATAPRPAFAANLMPRQAVPTVGPNVLQPRNPLLEKAAAGRTITLLGRSSPPPAATTAKAKVTTKGVRVRPQ